MAKIPASSFKNVGEKIGLNVLDKTAQATSRGAATMGSRGAAKMFADNVKKGFPSAASIGKPLMTGAIGGGVIGAGVADVQGEDMWDGAKSGAMKGAVAYGGLQVAKTGFGAKAGESAFSAGKRFNQENGVSKSVTALMRNKKEQMVASGMMKPAARRSR